MLGGFPFFTYSFWQCTRLDKLGKTVGSNVCACFRKFFLTVYMQTMGRVVHGASCPWGELSLGRIVHGANCPWGDLSVGRIVRGAKCPWGEMSVGRVVRGARCHGASCHGASCPGASCPGASCLGASGPGTKINPSLSHMFSCWMSDKLGEKRWHRHKWKVCKFVYVRPSAQSRPAKWTQRKSNGCGIPLFSPHMYLRL
jgi:hypothetical protein